MANPRTNDTVDIVRKLVSLLTPTLVITGDTDNPDGSFTLDIPFTYWLRPRKRVTIDSIVYNIESFVINESITIRPIVATDPKPSVLNFQLPAPHFFHGTTQAASDQQNKKALPQDRTPFVWLYEVLDEEHIEDELEPWGRTSSPRLYFMDETSSGDWLAPEGKTNVIEPMRQMVELFFENINDFEGDKYEEVKKWTETARQNWGKHIIDKGMSEKFFKGNLSGLQVGFNFVMSKAECAEEIEVFQCNISVIVEVTAEASAVANDGTANAIVSGEQGNVAFAWTGPSGFTATTQLIENLAPGLYEVTVTDDIITSPVCSAVADGTVDSASFVPSDDPDLEVWFNARDNASFNSGGISDLDAVVKWDGKAPTTLDLEQLAPLFQFIYRSSGYGTNDVAHVDLDGIDHWSSVVASIPQPFTAIFAMRKKGNSGTQRIIAGSGGLSTSIYTNSTPQVNVFAGANFVNGAIDTSEIILTVVVNGTGTKVRINDGSYVTGDAGTNAIALLVLGAIDGGGQEANMLMAEWMIFTADKSGGVDDQVNAYLNTEIGIY